MRYLLACMLVAVSLAAALDPEKDCSDDVLMLFFPKIFVEEVLSAHQIDSKKIASISAELSKVDESVIKIIEEKAKNMKPNPLEDMEAREVRDELFSKALLQVFSDVLNRYEIKDKELQIKLIEEIQNKRLDRWKQCAEQMPELNTPDAPSSKI